MPAIECFDLGISKEAIKSVAKKGSQPEMLQLMENLFQRITNFDLSPIIQKGDWDFVRPSHVKKNFFSEIINGKGFNIELIQFTGDQYTGLHTHPELLVDGIISGSICERNYLRIRDNYKLVSEDILKAGSLQKKFDDEGSPHSVCAMNGPALSLCISYGSPMKYIDESLIIPSYSSSTKNS